MENNYLILGAGCGVGIELIRLLSKESNSIIATYSSDASKNRLLELQQGLNFKIAHLDLRSLDLIYSFLKKISYVKYLVDLAHSNIEDIFASIKDEDIINYYQLNVIHRAIFLKYITRKMLTKREGRLLYVSSTACVYPNKGQGLYSSAKAAVEKIYKAIGIEMYNRGISSVILRFGYINSGRSLDFIKNKKDTLSDFSIDPFDAAKAIEFFLHDNGRCFNADEVIIDRGFFSSKRF